MLRITGEVSNIENTKRKINTYRMSQYPTYHFHFLGKHKKTLTHLTH